MADVAMFAPANAVYRDIVHKWRNLDASKRLDEVTFVKLLKQVEDIAFTPQNIKNGFKSTGLFPLKFENVHLDRIIYTEEERVVEENEIEAFNEEHLFENELDNIIQEDFEVHQENDYTSYYQTGNSFLRKINS